MASYKRFEDLPIWQEAREFSKNVFWASKEGEFSKELRLCSQIRASSGSIMDNIAEGFERNGMESLSSSFILQKVHAVNHEANYIVLLTMGFCRKKNLKH
jgi:four helix bundle protein